MLGFTALRLRQGKGLVVWGKDSCLGKERGGGWVRERSGGKGRRRTEVGDGKVVEIG